MGTSTYAEPVPFKINVWNGDLSRQNGTGFPHLDDFIHYLEHTTYEYECGEKRGQPLPDFKREGWKLDMGTEYGKLSTNTFVKGDQEVYYVNESKHDGCEETSFFATDRSALEKFCEDWGFDKSSIKEKAVVTQTL